jgi:hypothetical protein
MYEDAGALGAGAAELWYLDAPEQRSYLTRPAEIPTELACVWIDVMLVPAAAQRLPRRAPEDEVDDRVCMG